MHHLSLQADIARSQEGNTGSEEIPSLERENGVTNQLPQPVVTLHEGPYLALPHPETYRAETSGHSSKQGGGAGTQRKPCCRSDSRSQ